MTEGPSGSLRGFGLLVGGVFLVLAAWPLLIRRADPRLWALAAAVFFVGSALIYPRALGPVHRLWMKLGHILGWINTRIILGILFYVVFTPMGLLFRLMGRDPMQRAFDPRATTYRTTREARPASHMRHQF